MKYKITYRTNTDHDICKVWEEAESPEQAASQALDEYWDIEEIISVSILK